MKRAICLILVLALLACGGVALATAGTASDPLISQSYMSTYRAAVLEQVKGLLTAGENAVKAYLNARLPDGEGEESSNPLNGFKQVSIAQGEVLNLPFGSSLILVSGGLHLQHNGTVLDTAAGAELSSGAAVGRNVRLLVAEDTQASFTATSSTQVLIEGTYTKGSSHSFSDVPEGHFAYEAIGYFAGQGLVNGVAADRFDPSGQMTRGMVVTLLGRVYGINAERYPGSSFSDVSADQYYAPYIQWASKVGLVSGMGDGTFAPDRPITRQEMAKLVVDFADYAGYPLASGTAGSFADDGQIAAWAKEEVYRAAGAGLINGRGQNRFEPAATANRAEVCTLVYRLITA